MTIPPGRGVPDAAAQARAVARRQARGLSGLMVVLPGMLVAVLLMVVFILLDYTFDQDPHRIFKVALGVLALGSIMAIPKLGLLILPVVTPFLPWVPPTPIPGLNPLNVLLFSIFGTYALARSLQRQPLLRPNHLGGVLGAMLLLCALSIVRGAAFPTGYGYNVANASLQLFRSATTFATYFIVLSMARGLADRRRVLWAVMLGLLAESVVTVLLGRSGSGGGAVGAVGQSNELGSFLALFSVVAFAMVPAVRNWFGRLVLLGIFGTAVLALIFSLSRGAMLAFVASLVLVAWRSSRVLFAVLVAAMLLSPFWAPDYLKDRITSSQKQVEGSDEMALDTAAEARIETWQSIMQVVREHPIEGVGFTGLGYVLPDIGTALGLEEVKDSAHNTYLRMFAEMGILGIVLFVWLLVKCLRLAELTIRGARTTFDRGLGIGLCGATVSMAVSCAFGDRFFNVVITSSFWILCALAEDALADRREPA